MTLSVTWTARQPLDAARLEECVWAAARSDEFILRSASEQLEDRLTRDLPEWQAVGVSGLAGAVLVLTLSAEDDANAVVVKGAEATASAAVAAAVRSGARRLSVGDRPGGRWVVTDVTTREQQWPADHGARTDATTERTRREVVVVREPSSIAAVTDADAILLDLSGAQEVRVAGELAVLLTRDDATAACWRALRNHGQPVGRRFHHEHVGVNARVDELNARYVLAELAEHADRADRLRGMRGELVGAWSDAGAQDVPDAAVGGGVAIGARSRLAAALADAGVSVRPWHPGRVLVPVHGGWEPDHLDVLRDLQVVASGVAR